MDAHLHLSAKNAAHSVLRHDWACVSCCRRVYDVQVLVKILQGSDHNRASDFDYAKSTQMNGNRNVPSREACDTDPHEAEDKTSDSNHHHKEDDSDEQTVSGYSVHYPFEHLIESEQYPPA